MGKASDGSRVWKRLFPKREKAINVQSDDKTYARINNKGIWRRFFHTFRVAKIPFWALLVYIAVNALQSLIIVKVPQINANFFAGDASVKSVSMFIGIELLTTVISQVVLYMSYYVRARTNRNLRNTLWGKILRLKPKYFDKVSSNTLISRITVDSESINEFIMDVILDIVFQVYMLILTIYEMSTISIKAGLVLLIFVPAFMLFSFVMGRLSLKFNNSLKFKMSDMTAYLSNLLSCLPLIKSFNRQRFEHRRGKKVIDEYYTANTKTAILDFLKSVLGAVVGTGPEICIILFGIKMLGDGTVDAEGWYAFYLYAGTFIGFVSTLGTAWTRSKSIQGSLNKVSDILYEEEECVDSYVKEIVESGDIMFDKVSFGYDDDADLFHDVSFTIARNETTAIIGYSGSGKSTLLKLLERMYEPNEGRILAGGSELREYDIKHWRKKIAYVSQSTPLMSGTIRGNVLYGIDREVSDEEIMKVAKLALADEFIDACPDKLEYEVGQFGTRLSGGQRQKLSMMRAILTNAELLILDEPTSSLDMVSSNEILSIIESLKGTRTIIIVTHDAKAVENADNIIVVNKDHTVNSGSKEEMQLNNDFLSQLAKA